MVICVFLLWVYFCDKGHVVHTLKQAGHEILFQNTEVLDNTSNHYVRLHREAIEISKHQQSFNKKRRKFKTQQSLAPSTEKYSLQKVNELYPATRTGDHCTQDQLMIPINQSDR